MKDQHKKITGYRDLSQEEIDMMNRIKELAEMTRNLIEELEYIDSTDKRWVEVGKTNLQMGYMALVRSVAQPTTF